MTEKRKVIRHPLHPGKWTVCITDANGSAIYGCYDAYSVAVAWCLAP